MDKIDISWDEYHRLIEELAILVYRSQYQFDQIICLARGGLRAGDILSRLFRKPLAVMFTSSYRGDNGTTQSKDLWISKNIVSADDTVCERILLVDDLVDSGFTLEAVIDLIRTHYPHITQMKTAVLWSKKSSSFHPDFAVQRLTNDPWITQPFEKYDHLGPNDLILRRETSAPSYSFKAGLGESFS